MTLTGSDMDIFRIMHANLCCYLVQKWILLGEWEPDKAVSRFKI